MRNHVLSFIALLFAGILAAGTSDSGSTRGSRPRPSSTPSTSYDSGPRAVVSNESRATPEDVSQAKKLLREMPAACGSSYASAALDGTVTVKIICQSDLKSLNGLIRIKDGIVTEIE